MTEFTALESSLYASSGSATPELMRGTQGWSPYSSVLYSDDDVEEGDILEHDAQSTKRRSSDFPLPPSREYALKPSVVRATSAMDLAAIRKMQAWTFDVFSKEEQGDEESQVLHIDDLRPLPGIIKRKSAEKPMHISMPASTVPTAPSKLEEVEASAGSEPDEYPFPYMIATAMPGLERSFSQEAEDNKLQRLQASLSLLNVMGEDNDNMAENSLTKGLEVLSPEQGAPSLAEQMAYACGLGNAYSWSSPAPLDFASPAGLFHPVGLVDATTYAQEERKMASRHVRQVVASNGSAPMPRKVSMQNIGSGQRAEIGSSWSHGHGDYEEEELDCDESVESDTSPSVRDRDAASSSVDSFLGSPILNGALSADDFFNSAASSSNDSQIDTPLTCATSVYSNEASHHNKSGLNTDDYFIRGLGNAHLLASQTASTSPASLHEFSYIVESEELVRDTPSTNLHDKGYFNGSTFSPPLETPEVEEIPSMFLGSVPSPSLDQASIEPCLKSYTMSRSISTGSVLERPRPISRLEPSSFFGGMEMEYLHQMVSSASTSSIRKLSECAESKSVASSLVSSSPHSRTISDVVSIRISALSSSRSTSALGERDAERNSIHSNASSSHSRMERLLAELPKKTVSFASSQSELIISTRSSFSGNLSSLSPKALAQVKEACRAKEDYARNIDFDRWSAQEEKLKAAMTQGKKRSDSSSSPQKKKLFYISKNHASESALAQINKPLPPLKKKSSKLSLRKEVPGSADIIKDAPEKNRKRQPSCTVTIPDTARVNLPTVLIARTNSQRRRGYTGIPETEPRALALAKMGIYTDAPTRSSKVEAITKSSVPLEKADLISMPSGVILIVEEKHVEMSRVLACSP